MTIHTANLSTGVTLTYALQGTPGKPVLCFVHGLGAAMEQFRPQADYFDRDYHVLRFSLRGHGGSSAPTQPTPEAYSLRTLAQDIHALLAHLGIEELHYVGNSLGGLLGYELIKLGQPQLLSLTTFGTTAELHSPKMVYWSVVAMTHLLGVKGIAAFIGKTATQDRAVGVQLQAMYRKATKDALLHIARHIADYDYTNTLREADLPLLLIQCALDKEINAALDSTIAALAAAPRGSVVHLDEAGHFANLEQPEAFNHILETFLSQLPVENR